MCHVFGQLRAVGTFLSIVASRSATASFLATGIAIGQIPGLVHLVLLAALSWLRCADVHGTHPLIAELIFRSM